MDLFVLCGHKNAVSADDGSQELCNEIYLPICALPKRVELAMLSGRANVFNFAAECSTFMLLIGPWILPLSPSSSQKWKWLLVLWGSIRCTTINWSLRINRIKRLDFALRVNAHAPRVIRAEMKRDGTFCNFFRSAEAGSSLSSSGVQITPKNKMKREAGLYKFEGKHQKQDGPTSRGNIRVLSQFGRTAFSQAEAFSWLWRARVPM